MKQSRAICPIGIHFTLINSMISIQQWNLKRSNFLYLIIHFNYIVSLRVTHNTQIRAVESIVDVCIRVGCQHHTPMDVSLPLALPDRRMLRALNYTNS